MHVKFRREKIRQRKSRGRSRYRREDQRVEHVLLVLGKRRLKREPGRWWEQKRPKERSVSEVMKGETGLITAT